MWSRCSARARLIARWVGRDAVTADHVRPLVHNVNELRVSPVQSVDRLTAPQVECGDRLVQHVQKLSDSVNALRSPLWQDYATLITAIAAALGSVQACLAIQKQQEEKDNNTDAASWPLLRGYWDQYGVLNCWTTEAAAIKYGNEKEGNVSKNRLITLHQLKEFVVKYEADLKKLGDSIKQCNSGAQPDWKKVRNSPVFQLDQAVRLRWRARKQRSFRKNENFDKVVIMRLVQHVVYNEPPQQLDSIVAESMDLKMDENQLVAIVESLKVSEELKKELLDRIQDLRSRDTVAAKSLDTTLQHLSC